MYSKTLAKIFWGICLICILVNVVHAQVWTPIQDFSYRDNEEVDIRPIRARYFEIDDQAMKDLLWKAPKEADVNPKNSNTVLSIPNIQGEIEQYRIVEYSMMEEGLAAKYPDLKTFVGVGLRDQSTTIRIDYTAQGFRAVINKRGLRSYIDHVYRGQKNLRMLYQKLDLVPRNKWSCGVVDEVNGEFLEKDIPTQRSAGDCVFRSYRLAQACTGEYANFHGATSAAQSGLVLSAVITVINRINEVYEADITVRFILINNTDLLFYYNGATDPYTNNDGGAMLSQNITTCDNIIGNANYDIGHVFSTGGGGVAYLNSVCNNSLKAGGVTGLGSPVGDPFSIDYVAHEVGHQFGGNHTQNNNCNRAAIAAREPGSASTIMGYAGICSPNVQNNSDAYFHAYSIQEMTARITSTFCFSPLPLENNQPDVLPLDNFSIPISTPFVLTTQATDVDEDVLYYGWEQMDNAVATMPPVSTNTGGPTFRSIFYTTDPFRFFPPLSNVVNGTSNTWQVLPSVARTMSFRTTVRDHVGMAGCTDEANMIVTTVAGNGSFAVTSPSGSTTWTEFSSQTITWNVAGTNQAPINAPLVEIFLSYDNGQSFNNSIGVFPNTGSAMITVPQGLTSQGRIMVKGHNHIFYQVNVGAITILEGGPNFIIQLSDLPGLQVCDNASFQVKIKPEFLNGFSDDVILSVSSTYPGVNLVLEESILGPGDSTYLMVSDLIPSSDLVTITVTGTSGSIVKQNTFSFTIVSLSLPVVALAPVDNAMSISTFPTFTWENPNNGNTELQITRKRFFERVERTIVTDSESHSVDYRDPLEGASFYYWRVRSTSACGVGEWSDTLVFQTQACFLYETSDLPKAISSMGTPQVNSVMPIIDRGTISDLDIVELRGVHSYIDDLTFRLISPAGTNILVLNRPCGSEDDFDLNLDQQAPNNPLPCPPIDRMTYRPNSGSLNSFNTQSLKGNWTLQVNDVADQDGGQLNQWKLRPCATNFCRLTVENDFDRGAGSLAFAVACANPGDTIRFDSMQDSIWVDMYDQQIVINKNLVILGDPNKNYRVMSSHPTSTLTVNGGQTVRMEGFTISTSQLDGAGLENNGILTIKDIEVLGTNPKLLNKPQAQLIIQGENRILRE